jgi:hypothetical protein
MHHLLQRKVSNSSAVYCGINVEKILNLASLSRPNNEHAVWSHLEGLFAHGDSHFTCYDRASSQFVVFHIPMANSAGLYDNDVEADVLRNGNGSATGEVRIGKCNV